MHVTARKLGVSAILAAGAAALLLVAVGGMAGGSSKAPVVTPAGGTGQGAPTAQVHVGDVVGRARLENGLCVFDEPIGVAVDPGSMAEVEVTWAFDEQCRAVVSSIGQPDSPGEQPAPRDGEVVVPAIRKER